MPTRTTAPVGSPCWTDLWTSDVDGARRFYGELFGWEASDPDPEHAGYFIFNRDGAEMAGGMGDMGDMRADNSWKVYLNTRDIETTIGAAKENGADILAGPDAVDGLGIQAVLVDPTGADHGMWQPGTFQGFTVLDEPGAPSWFELHTRDYQRALSFYAAVYGLKTEVVGDTDEFRYSTLRSPEADDEVGGIMDSSGFLPEGVASHWVVYWETDDVDGSIATLKKLGGAVVLDPEDTPYGRIATVADPAGAEFRLRTGPK